MTESRNRSLVPSLFGFPFLNEDIWELEATPQSGLSVYEDKKHIYVEAHLPGLSSSDIDVTFESGVLWIKGSKQEEEKDKKYYRKASSAFSYRIHVPGPIDEKKEPEAIYKNGVMKVSFQKSAGKEPKKINVKSQ